MERYDIIQSGFYAILDNTDAMIFVKDHNLVYVAASLPFAQMVGKSSIEEVVGKTDFELFENQELAKRYNDDDLALLAGNEDLLNHIEPLADEYGHPRYSFTSKYILKNKEDGGGDWYSGIVPGYHQRLSGPSALSAGTEIFI